MKKRIIALFLAFCPLVGALAQTDSVKVVKPEDKALKFNLNADGSHYFQATFLNQAWVRYTNANPGSTIFGDEQSNMLDIGLRRTRIQMFGQITDRAFVYFQFGLNNFNRAYQLQNNRKIQAFFHDAVCEYRLTKENQLKLGAGLTIANGLSRFSQPSIGTIMTLDVPVFAQATVDQTDLFSRKLSIYARGQVGKIDYRFSLSDPFQVNTNGQAISATGQAQKRPDTTSFDATFAQYGKHNLQYQGYVQYQFWEKEGHTTPYMTGTYLGKKKVLNLGAGIIYQPDATWRTLQEDKTQFVYDNMVLWAVEGFLDTPIDKEKGTALSAYVGYFNTNYGRNYLRFNGLMNPANGYATGYTNFVPGTSNSSFGNAIPMFGTGNVIYSQIGFVLPHDADKPALMPFASYTRSNYKKLNDASNLYDIGMNLLLNGHKSKVSIDYQNRPVFGSDLNVRKRASSVILQYQIFI